MTEITRYSSFISVTVISIANAVCFRSFVTLSSFGNAPLVVQTCSRLGLSASSPPYLNVYS